jgi:hypothetical protein
MNHAAHVGQDPEFFKRHEQRSKQMKLVEGGPFQLRNVALVQACFKVLLKIAKKRKTHSIGEMQINPCTLLTGKGILRKTTDRKVEQIPLSNDTVQSLIYDISYGITQQVDSAIEEALSSLFAIQLDESTDVNSCSLFLFAQ